MRSTARKSLYASTLYLEPALPPPFAPVSRRIGSMCGAFSRKESRWRATSSRSSFSLGRRAFASPTVKSLGNELSMLGGSFSAADGQAIGENAGEAGGPDLCLSLLYVVFDEAVGDTFAFD